MQLFIKKIYYVSVREVAALYRSRGYKKKPLMKPDCPLGVVPQPTDSRLSETSRHRLTSEAELKEDRYNQQDVNTR